MARNVDDLLGTEYPLVLGDLVRETRNGKRSAVPMSNN